MEIAVGKSLIGRSNDVKQIFNITSHYQRIKKFYLRYERLLMPITLVTGFLVDYFTFTSIQIKITFALLLLYWVITGTTIAFIHLFDGNKLPQKLKYIRLFAPLIIQFTFGALLSSSLVFYWLSGAFSVSWPIILVVALLMVFNDVFRHYFLKPAVQVSVYFFTTLSLFSLILPFIFKSLSPWLFVLAGALSMVTFISYISLLSRVNHDIKQQRKYLFISVSIILLTMNVFYFGDIIPPIPLSLREAGLYHSLTISNNSYVMLGEIENFWQRILYGQTIHVVPNQKIYLYTAIFAPENLQTIILHDWQYYDPIKKRWLSQDMLSFSIIGGRKQGYKGYSFMSNLSSGAWRIYVENQRGQVLARVRFNVEKTEGEIQLQKTVR